MRVSGFTFIKNAIQFEYPIVESIRSVLPLVDEMIVAVGDSNDGTRNLITSIPSGKIRIIDTVWDTTLKEGGAVLADETNKAFRAISGNPDWCLYIQGDEVLHEQYHNTVLNAMRQWKDNPEVDGLLFKYRHFYGSFDYIASSSRWYRNEIRIIRHNPKIYSYRDAQGFRKNEDEKLRVKGMDAYMYHYGWVRPPQAMMSKVKNFENYWGENPETDKLAVQHSNDFDYSRIDSLEKFTGTHPAVMQERIERMNWKFDYDLSYNKTTAKEVFKKWVEKITGRRPFDYNNYNPAPLMQNLYRTE